VSDVNTVAITGRLTRDPEVISDGKGTRFGIASNRSYRRAGEEEWQEETTFVTVTAWSGLGKRVASKLRKGSFVTVSGRLELNTWDQDGERRSQLRVVALEVTSPDFFKKADESEPLPEAA
jgi:single-strand DNA-binding protein